MLINLYISPTVKHVTMKERISKAISMAIAIIFVFPESGDVVINVWIKPVSDIKYAIAAFITANANAIGKETLIICRKLSVRKLIPADKHFVTLRYL